MVIVALMHSTLIIRYFWRIGESFRNFQRAFELQHANKMALLEKYDPKTKERFDSINVE